MVHRMGEGVMKAKLVTYKKVVLELEEDEARWLQRMVQNPIGIDLEDEDPIEQDIRHVIFNGIKAVLGGR